MENKRLMLILLAGVSLLFAACSYATDFAVINESNQPIEVRYKIKNYPGPFAPPVEPATIETPKLSKSGDQQWTPLNSSQYQIDVGARLVVVQLLPGHSLRVATMHRYGGHADDRDAQEFPIEELILVGTHGEVRLVGSQARTTFSEMSKALYMLTYK